MSASDIPSDALNEQSCLLCDESNKSISLSCSHNLCEECIHQLKKTTSTSFSLDEVKCPFCCQVTEVSSNAGLMCDRCLTKPAEFGCITCKGNLCLECWDLIHSFGELKSHAKKEIGTIWHSISRCERHPDCDQSMVIKMDHLQFGCARCMIDPTFMFSGQTFGECAFQQRAALNTYRDELKEILLKLDQERSHLYDLKTAIVGDDTAKPSITGSLQQSITSTIQQFEEIQQRLLDYRDNLISKMKELAQRKLDLISQSDCQIDASISSGLKGYSRLEQVLGAVDDYSLLRECDITINDYQTLLDNLKQVMVPILDSEVYIPPEPIFIPKTVNLSFTKPKEISILDGSKSIDIPLSPIPIPSQYDTMMMNGIDLAVYRT